MIARKKNDSEDDLIHEIDDILLEIDLAILMFDGKAPLLGKFVDTSKLIDRLICFFERYRETLEEFIHTFM